MPKKQERSSRKPIPETTQSKMARIQNAGSQQQREYNEREDFSQAAAGPKRTQIVFVGSL
jgi:hypothetical protein